MPDPVATVRTQALGASARRTFQLCRAGAPRDPSPWQTASTTFGPGPSGTRAATRFSRGSASAVPTVDAKATFSQAPGATVAATRFSKVQASPPAVSRRTGGAAGAQAATSSDSRTAQRCGNGRMARYLVRVIAVWT